MDGSRVGGAELAGRAGPRSSIIGRARPLLFGIAIFLSSALTFWAEPMAAKMILPLLGGSPAVWNTALVFFQLLLFCGYLYTFLVSRWLGLRTQLLVHLALLGAVVVSLPPVLPDAAAAFDSPVLSVLAMLARCLGVPFLALCTTAPLLQLWYSAGRFERSADPYFLYAVSNAGSFAGLAAYPLLIEKLLDLDTQGTLWAVGFCVTAAAVLAAGSGAVRSAAAMSPLARQSRSLEAAGAPPSAADRVRWLVLAFVPSSLLVGVTSYITTDVASVPLLWVLPLGLYLATFIITFARRPVIAHRWAVHGHAAAMIAFLILARPLGLSPLALVGVHLLVFFFAALTCHGELARRRPGTASLAEFYLWLAAGGVLGGIFNTIVAPLLFSSNVEYIAVLLVACALRPALFGGAMSWRADLVLAVLLGLVIASVKATDAILPGSGTAVVIVVSFVLATGLALCSSRPLPFALAVFVALGLVPEASSGLAIDWGRVLHAERSFFGTYRVRLGMEGELMLLMHGTTLHGAQFTDPARRREPITYYHREGPFADLFLGEAAPHRERVGVVGLGTGGLSCYARPGDRWTFFEIDPLVERLARDTRFFHYLEDCAPGAAVNIGDGRVSLRAVPDGAYDLLVVDAFSSDSIPVHLLTREAVRLYVEKLAPGGVLAIHVSNRFFDLKRVLVPIAGAEGLALRIRDFKPAADVENGRRGVGPAAIVALSRTADGLHFLDRQGWSPPEPDARAVLWTDRYSDVISALR
jgi:hypothetical protein